MTSQLETRDIVVDGIRSPVVVGGPTTNPHEAVVFVHGNNAGADWRPLMTPVSEFARVVAPDLPGFGDADKPADWQYTVPAYAAHLAGVVEQLGIERAHLVAHDFGGPFALAWTAGHLEAVGSITLINTPARINHTAAKIWRTPVLGELSWRTARASNFRKLFRRTDPGLPDADRDEITRHAMVPATQRTVLRLYRATGEPAIAPYVEPLTSFDGEVLIVWGDGDAYIATEQADEQRRIFQHARIHLVPGAGHWPWLEQPGPVAFVVTNFLREQVAPA
ncbi:MAG: alpha/beta fold hydrolase [Mycobacterium sp.]